MFACVHGSNWVSMRSCSLCSSVLDLDAFERTNKAESLGVVSADGSSSNGGENLQDADFTCKLFRFLQLLCEGHNASEWLHVNLGYRGVCSRTDT